MAGPEREAVLAQHYEREGVAGSCRADWAMEGAEGRGVKEEEGKGATLVRKMVLAE